MATVEQSRSKAVILGVCADFARRADVDPSLCRVTAVLVCIFFAPVAIPSYILAAAMLRSQSRQQGRSFGSVRAAAEKIASCAR